MPASSPRRSACSSSRPCAATTSARSPGRGSTFAPCTATTSSPSSAPIAQRPRPRSASRPRRRRAARARRARGRSRSRRPTGTGSGPSRRRPRPPRRLLGRPRALRANGRIRSSTGSPLSIALSAYARTLCSAHAPPTNPSIVPSPSTSATLPASALVGRCARTTVACHERLALARRAPAPAARERR